MGFSGRSTEAYQKGIKITTLTWSASFPTCNTSKILWIYITYCPSWDCHLHVYSGCIQANILSPQGSVHHVCKCTFEPGLSPCGHVFAWRQIRSASKPVCTCNDL